MPADPTPTNDPADQSKPEKAKPRKRRKADIRVMVSDDSNDPSFMDTDAHCDDWPSAEKWIADNGDTECVYWIIDLKAERGRNRMSPRTPPTYQIHRNGAWYVAHAAQAHTRAMARDIVLNLRKHDIERLASAHTRAMARDIVRVSRDGSLRQWERLTWNDARK